MLSYEAAAPAPKGRGAAGATKTVKEDDGAFFRECVFSPYFLKMEADMLSLADAAPATKGRGAAGATKTVKEDKDDDSDWDDADEMIPSLLDLQSTKVSELKDLCGRHGLKKAGNKDELVQRLCEKCQLKAGANPSHSSSSGAAVMYLDPNSDEIKYKVKLGRAGAVMMPELSPLLHSDDDAERHHHGKRSHHRGGDEENGGLGK